MSKSNRKGRSTNGPPFIQMYNYVFESPAFRALKPGPRALLFELIHRHDGKNNGRIGLGIREACKALRMVDHESVTKYFEALQAHGFIVLRKDSGFTLKMPDERTAREWELTMYPVGIVGATKGFLNWTDARKVRSGKSAPSRAEIPNVVSLISSKRPRIRAEIPNLSDVNRLSAGAGFPTTYRIYHTLPVEAGAKRSNVASLAD